MTTYSALDALVCATFETPEVANAGLTVVCAVTGAHIPLHELRYWSVDRQEAYASPEIATRRSLGQS